MDDRYIVSIYVAAPGIPLRAGGTSMAGRVKKQTLPFSLPGCSAIGCPLGLKPMAGSQRV